MEIGHSCVQTNVQAYKMFGEKSSMLFTLDMKRPIKEEPLSKLESSGRK